MRKWLLGVLVALTSAPIMSAERELTHPNNSGSSIEIAGPVLMVADLERSLKFYVDGLGLQVSTRLPGNPGPGAILVAPGQARTPFLLIRQSADVPARSTPILHGNALSRIMVVAPDSAALAARLTAAGFAHEPVNTRGIFFVKDPDGFTYEVMQRNSRH